MNIIKCFDKSKAIYTDIFAKHCIICGMPLPKKKEFYCKECRRAFNKIYEKQTICCKISMEENGGIKK